MSKRFPIPGALTTSRDLCYSFGLQRQIHSRPPVHGAFGTIDAPANRPGRQGAQTMIPLGTISQTMQAILHHPFHAIADLIRAHASQRPGPG